MPNGTKSRLNGNKCAPTELLFSWHSFQIASMGDTNATEAKQSSCYQVMSNWVTSLQDCPGSELLHQFIQVSSGCARLPVKQGKKCLNVSEKQ